MNIAKMIIALLEIAIMHGIELEVTYEGDGRTIEACPVYHPAYERDGEVVIPAHVEL